MKDVAMDKLLKEGLQTFLDVVPTIVKIVAILFVGLILSKILARVVRVILVRLKFEHLLERLGFLKKWQSVMGERSIEVSLSNCALYMGDIGTMMMVSMVMGFKGLHILFERFFAFIPNLMIATVLCAAGIFVAEFIRTVIDNVLSSRRDVAAPQLISQFVYAMVVVFTVLTAANQLGLHIGLLQSLLVIFFGGLTFALTLSFALGAQSFIAQWIARYHVMLQYNLGDKIKVGDDEGMLFQFAPLVAILKTEEGHVILPYNKLLEADVIRVAS